MKALVFAYSEIGYEAIRTLLDLKVDIAGIVTHADNPAEERWWHSVADLGKTHGIPVILPERPDTPETLAWCRDRRPDILFSFYYRLMLPPSLLSLPPL